MKPKYKLGRYLMNFILFACLFLQNCGGKKLTDLPAEMLNQIFLYLDMEDLLKGKKINKYFYEVITGLSLDDEKNVQLFTYTGIKYEDKLFGIDDLAGQSALSLKRELDFSKEKLKKLTPETIPTLLFCRLTGIAKNLPKAFWPYLNKTRIHTLDLTLNSITDNIVGDLPSYLENSQVVQLDLWLNDIGDEGAAKLAFNLKGTKVKIINLGGNKITATGLQYIVENLDGTNVVELNLINNKIIISYDDHFEVLKSLVENLANTKLETIHLNKKNISIEAQEYLKNHTQIKWIFISNEV